MISREHKLYLRKLKINRILVNICQILILILSIFIWEYLSSKGIINSFIYSSPSKVLRTIIDLYKENNLFNQGELNPVDTYIAGFIDDISTDFKYDFELDDVSNIKYTYYVDTLMELRDNKTGDIL